MDWSLQKSISHLKDVDTGVVRNKFEILQADGEELSPNATYNNFIASHGKTAAGVLRLKPKHSQTIPWESKSIKSQNAIVKEKASIKN